MAQAGWAIATLGAIALLFAAPLVDFDPPRYDARVLGVAGDVRCTATRKHGDSCDVDYGFYDQHRNPRMATSSGVQPALSRGDTIWIEYDSRASRRSRIVGTGGDPVRWQWIFAPVGLIAIGLVLAIRAGRAAAEDVRLLRFGLPTTGRLVEKRDRFTFAVQRRAVHTIEVLTFEYVVKGRTHRVAITPFSSAALLDDTAEPMIYDPADPDNATTLDDLPGKPRVRDDGTLAADAGFVYHLLVLPAATLFVTVAAIAILVGRILY